MLAVTRAVAPLNAQALPTVTDATAAANRLLQSSDPKEIAWGAFTAEQYHLSSAVPLLVGALARSHSADADPRGIAEFAVLDALVQLHSQVPADVLRGSLDRFPIPALILLDHATGDRDALLLPRLDVTTGFEWEAIANLLLRSKPPGFAMRLLDGLRLQLSVYVTDQAGTVLGSGFGGGTETDCMVASTAPGLPPMADYTFAAAGAGATILSIGPQTVYYVRHTFAVPIIPCSHVRRAQRPADDDRVTYVNALVKANYDAVPLRQLTSATVLWSTPDRFREELARHRQDVADQYRRIVSLLVSARCLTEDETRTLTPTISVTVVDERKNKSEPLPLLSDRRGFSAPAE